LENPVIAGLVKIGFTTTSLEQRLSELNTTGVAYPANLWHNKVMRKSGKREFSVVVERDAEGYYVATVPQLQGCHTQARSLD
jgi:hypothetical protein